MMKQKQTTSWLVRGLALALVMGVAFLVAPTHAQAKADWSRSQVDYQYGQYANPDFTPESSGPNFYSSIVTFQHASGWKYGDNFFFIDLLLPNNGNTDLYGEWYPTLSYSKISGNEVSMGPIRDVGLIGGINFGADPNVLKWLPGVRLDWDMPGFDFLHTDFMAYLDANGGVDSGGAPAEDDSWMVDVNWGSGFELGETNWRFEGHVEYIAARDNEFGDNVRDWVLAQPQLFMDIGEFIPGIPDETLQLGTEVQVWINKLGSDKDEFAPQLFVSWWL